MADMQNESVSSTDEEDVAAETLEATEASEAESSTADGDDDEGLLAVVRNAVEESKDEDDESSIEASPAEEEVTDQGEEQVEASSDAHEEEDYEGLPFNKHPRFQKLIRQRNEYREKAQNYDFVQDFMDQNSLSADEVAQGFRLMAMMKSQPELAYQELGKIVGDLALASGATLPEDLARKVEDGYVDQETAQTLWRDQLNARREAERAAAENQRYRMAEQQNAARSMAESVMAWESTVRKNDPDYDLKADMVEDRVKALVAERGRPRSNAEAQGLVKEAYDHVSARLKTVKGVKQPMKTAVGGKVSGTPTPEPQSLLDVIQNTLAQRA